MLEVLISCLLDAGWFDHTAFLVLILKGNFTLLCTVNTNLQARQQCFDVLLFLQAFASILSLFLFDVLHCAEAEMVPHGDLICTC